VIYAIRVVEMRKYIVARFGEAPTIINRPTKETRRTLARAIQFCRSGLGVSGCEGT